MGFMDFLKKLAENKTKEPIKEEKIAFNGLEDWIKKKEKDTKSKEKEVFVLTKDKILLVSEELENKIKNLELSNYKSRKVEDKIKQIVRENLENYVQHVREFIENLSKLEDHNLEKVVESTNKIFSDFDKKSYMNYQKATLLIGKEIATIKESTINLSKYFKKIFKENSELINSSKQLNSIKFKLDQINEIKKSAEKTNQEIKELEKKITKSNNKNNDFLQEIEKIKKSKDYTENLKKEQEIKLIREEVEKDMPKVREIIDFKILTNIFHVSEKEMIIIKAHKENFKVAFEKDNGENILRLFNEARLDDKLVSEKIKQINDQKQEITKIQETIKKDQTEAIFLEIEKLKLENENLENEKEKQLRSHEKIKTKNQEIIDSIKQNLNELNVIVID